MSILDSFNNIPKDYVPVNNRPIYNHRKKLEQELPYERYSGDKFLGYYWNQGDKFTFYYSPCKTIFVEKDAIILVGSGPEENTKGYVKQRAYDIVNLKSYRCTSCYNGRSNWTEDKVFNHPYSGKKVTLQNEAWQNMTLSFDIYNFRKELIYSNVLDGDDYVEIKIGDEIAELLKYGTYYFKFTAMPKLLGAQSVISVDEFEVNILSNKSNTTSQRGKLLNKNNPDNVVYIHRFLDGQSENEFDTDVEIIYDGGKEI